MSSRSSYKTATEDQPCEEDEIDHTASYRNEVRINIGGNGNFRDISTKPLHGCKNSYASSTKRPTEWMNAVDHDQGLALNGHDSTAVVRVDNPPAYHTGTTVLRQNSDDGPHYVSYAPVVYYGTSSGKNTKAPDQDSLGYWSEVASDNEYPNINRDAIDMSQEKPVFKMSQISTEDIDPSNNYPSKEAPEVRVCKLSEPLESNRTIHIEGIANSMAKSFSVKLQNGIAAPPMSEMPLQIAVLFEDEINKGSISCDSCVKRVWGDSDKQLESKETKEEFPFVKGNPFTLDIDVRKDGYHVFVDETFITSFRHQVPASDVSHLILDGDAKFFDVRYPHIKPLPYLKEIPNGLCVGTVICIDGFIPDEAENFQFGLQTNDQYYPDTDLVFHVKVQLQGMERKASCNSFIGGKWQVRKDVVGHLPFERSGKLDIKVTVWKHYFMVDVNDSFFAEYKYEIDPRSVTHLAFDGDVDLYSVQFLDNKLRPSKSKAASLIKHNCCPCIDTDCSIQ